ncbi:Gp15 family bacteriophage protein [Clostridium sp. BJN0001]|uniref:Gp15 family bacteriophage protein n=1 Tax=Clostridium sp. BJN0001 TaxID=2930219 RepID=UPI00246820DB|nr:Gp15 family bacteriophage protein [Clostridium sp. BJN0001]
MGRAYDIVDRIANANQKPKIKLNENTEFKINNSFAAAIAIKAYSEDKELSDEERIQKIFTVALNEEAREYIKSQEYAMPVYIIILNAIMAAIANMDLEDMEKISKKNPSSIE